MLQELYDFLSTYWAPRPRSKKNLNEQDEQDEQDDDGSQGIDEDGGQGQELGEETSPESMPGPSSPLPTSVDPNFQPLRTPQKGSSEEPERLDPYMAWTLGGEMVPTVSLGPAGTKTPAESVDKGGDDDLDEQLKRLECLECNYYTKNVVLLFVGSDHVFIYVLNLYFSLCLPEGVHG